MSSCKIAEDLAFLGLILPPVLLALATAMPEYQGVLLGATPGTSLYASVSKMFYGQMRWPNATGTAGSLGVTQGVPVFDLSNYLSWILGVVFTMVNVVAMLVVGAVWLSYVVSSYLVAWIPDPAVRYAAQAFATALGVWVNYRSTRCVLEIVLGSRLPFT